MKKIDRAVTFMMLCLGIVIVLKDKIIVIG